jgi:hypothetical protein
VSGGHMLRWPLRYRVGGRSTKIDLDGDERVSAGRRTLAKHHALGLAADNALDDGRRHGSRTMRNGCSRTSTRPNQ